MLESVPTLKKGKRDLNCSLKDFWGILKFSISGVDAINISGLLNPKKLGNLKNRML